MPRDYISGYESKLAKLLKPIGLGLIVWGIAYDNSNTTLGGAALSLFGCAQDAICSAKGYFNERLVLEYRKREEDAMRSSKD